jgi:CubicO group peptidase (beta-lactamase class C family)
MDVLAENYCTMALGWPDLGMVTLQKMRAVTVGYRDMLGALVQDMAVEATKDIVVIGYSPLSYRTRMVPCNIGTIPPSWAAAMCDSNTPRRRRFMMQIHSPEAAGMSSERLARLASHMAQLTADNQHPGIMTLIQRKGKVVHLGKHGLMDIEAGKPIAEDTIFRIQSMTKPIIAVAVLMLLEEGRLALNDPVARYIPSFADIEVETDAGPVAQNPPISLYHLLTHTSGLRSPPGTFGQRSRPLAEAVELVATLPLLFQPGTQWDYGTAYSVLGHVIELVADMPLADVLAERIFEPLGMTDTTFYVPPDKQARLAQRYDADASGQLMIDRDGADFTTPTSCPSGGGGLVSTLGDYLAFCNCLINNGRIVTNDLRLAIIRQHHGLVLADLLRI